MKSVKRMTVCAAALAAGASVSAWEDDGCSMRGFTPAEKGAPGSAPITKLLDHDGAMCLDGSPGAYYHWPGTGDGVNKWYLHHQGGGWCESLDDCYARSLTDLGSSNGYPAAAAPGIGYFSNDPSKNPLMANWNKVMMRYCDGASFSGNNATAQTYAVPKSNTTVQLHWRGMHIREAMVKSLMGNRLGVATDVVVSGCSAGGLATYLHTDQWCDALPNAKCVGLPDSGFFLDYQDPKTACSPTAADPPGAAADLGTLGTTHPGDYHCGLRWAFAAQNATAGINADCVAAHQASGDVWKCMFAEHSADHIRHPVFAMQSEYDSWQTHHVLAGGQPVQQMGDNITARLKADLLGTNNESGAFLDSCHHHCGFWNSIRIDGDMVSVALQKWYNTIGQAGAKKLWQQGKPYPCDDCCRMK